jgi:hypothetical protein
LDAPTSVTESEDRALTEIATALGVTDGTS